MTAFGADMYQAVKCLQVLFKSIDAKSLAKFRPEFVRTSMLLFFNNCADDLEKTIVNLNEGKLSHLRGTHMKTCTSLRYIFEIQGGRWWSYPALNHRVCSQPQGAYFFSLSKIFDET